MQSDRGFLLGFFILSSIASASVFLRACGQREIFAAQRAYTQRTGRAVPEQLLGCERCHVETRASHWKINRAAMHRDACTTCHRGDASASTYVGAGHFESLASDGTRKILSGAGALAKCNSCHTSVVEEQGEVAQGARLYEARQCDACHHAPLVDSSLMFGKPPLDGKKLTREFIYRFLLEPSAFDAEQPAGPHHLRAESQLLLSAKARVLSEAITKRAPKHPAPASKGGDAPKVIAQCKHCHEARLDTLGTKTHQDWIAEFLRKPRERSGFALHPDVIVAKADAEALTKHLALARHKTFEPKWPEPSRALDAAVDSLHGDPLINESCVACHSASPVTKRAHHAINDDTRRMLRSGHHGAFLSGRELENVLAFIDATRAAWPQHAHVATGEDIWNAARCERCHAQPFKSSTRAFAEVLAGPPHDYGFDEGRSAEFALLVAFVTKNELLSPPDPLPSHEQAARGERLCSELQCKKCFDDSPRWSHWAASAIADKLQHCALKRSLTGDERNAIASYLRE